MRTAWGFFWRLMVIELVIVAALYTGSAYRKAHALAAALDCRCDTCCELVIGPALDRGK